MTVLVTGGTGFLGSKVVRALLAGGEKVVAFDLFPNEANLADVSDQVEIVRGDLGKFSNVLRLIETHRPDKIYHFGALMSVASDADPESGIQANAMGTFHMLEAARLFKVSQLIFASSIGVISSSDPDAKTIHDFSPTRPDTVYGLTKLFSENLGLFYRRKYGFDYRCLRLPAVIGPGATSAGYVQYFNKIIEETAKGNPYEVYVEPDTRLPVVHISDAVKAFLDLAAAPKDQIKMVNYAIMGPNPSASAQELVDIMNAKIPGARLSFKVDEEIQGLLNELLRLPLDDRYARREWGWKPGFELDAIVDDFIAHVNAPSANSPAR